MAGLRASDLTAAIVEGVSKSLAKILLPKVRKMIREEIKRGMDQIISEGTFSSAAPASTQAAKETIAQRQSRARERARAIVERAGRIDDPLLDMVINAEDPQEEKELMMQEQLQQPMVDSKEVQRGDVVSPENINFNDRLEKLGIV
tara:strand:- start:4561 stop:4998 length:438 start_codon:yes stop_codon:yes gene_type:complete